MRKVNIGLVSVWLLVACILGITIVNIVQTRPNPTPEPIPYPEGTVAVVVIDGDMLDKPLEITTEINRVTRVYASGILRFTFFVDNYARVCVSNEVYGITIKVARMLVY